jgi:hypothetical protein
MSSRSRVRLAALRLSGVVTPAWRHVKHCNESVILWPHWSRSDDLAALACATLYMCDP